MDDNSIYRRLLGDLSVFGGTLLIKRFFTNPKEGVGV